MSNWNNQQQSQSNQRHSNNQERFYGNGIDNFTNFNGTFYNRAYTDARGSRHMQRFDVESSNLHATAAEFTPRNLTVTEDVATGSTGTVRKNPKYKPWKQNYGNSGRNKEQNGFFNHDRYNNRSGKVYNRSDYDNTEKYEDKAENRYDTRNSSRLEHNSEPDNRKYKTGKPENTDNYKQDEDRSKDKFFKGFGKNSRQDNSKYFEKNNGYGYKNKWNKNGSNHKQNKNATETNWRQNKAKERKNSLQNMQSNQRERLQDMLERLQLECMVCCERLRNTDQVWSCKQCYNILHLSCIKKWANTSKLDCGWRCPACQNTYASVPEEYFCYCEKMSNPKYEPGQVAHSCGEICGRKGRSCDHPCVLLCHPGPCPDCTVSVSRSCGCGATQATVFCNADASIVCGNLCNKLLNCGLHVCARQCHPGECADCVEFVCQECYCGKVGRKVRCTEETRGVTKYECDDVCGRLLDCKNHRCELACHSGSCAPCSTSPTEVTTCPCGQTKLKEERTSCFDPIPSCDKVCNKILKCGQPSEPHRCQTVCHQGECPPCPLITMVRCRCGYMDKEVSCSELTSKADDARCQKKCTKMRLCCKHKCNQYCCIEVDHHCMLLCNRALSCGLHRCEQECHRGRCGQCPRMSFDELFCECGASVLYPPVACGTRPPSCNQPCSRPRPCGHPVAHACHTGPCPPCTILCKRWCHGKHEQRGTILCHQDEFSCGLPCGKDLPCGQHKCIQPCHKGSCALPCVQPCPKPRPTCDHPCNQPCHPEGPCPDSPCRQTVRVTCQCGLRSSSRTCMDLAGEYQAIAMSQLASKMADIQKGQTVDLSDIVSGQKKHVTPKTLECTEECRVVERNRRLAIGLQIRNPDLSAKLTPRYSEFMRGWAKKDPRFCQNVHDKLSELVQLAKQSKQKSRSHSFETMNRDKRHLVHEYCEHFGCESQAYDAEPNRNVVATAFRDKSWLPSVSLFELIQRENGQRKVPGPMVSAKSVIPKREVTSFKVSTRPTRPPTPPAEYVDYFDDPPV